MRLTLMLAFSFLIIKENLIGSSPLYTLKDFRMELVSYNETLASDLNIHVGKINRTTVALNVSFTLLRDGIIVGENIMMHSEVEKLYRTEYKKTGFKIDIHFCKYMKTNSFGVRDMLQRYGNIRGCNLPKGFYYIRNLVPDTENFPKYLPLGSYKVETVFRWKDGAEFVRFFCYWTLEPLSNFTQE